MSFILWLGIGLLAGYLAGHLFPVSFLKAKTGKL